MWRKKIDSENNLSKYYYMEFWFYLFVHGAIWHFCLCLWQTITSLLKTKKAYHNLLTQLSETKRHIIPSETKNNRNAENILFFLFWKDKIRFFSVMLSQQAVLPPHEAIENPRIKKNGKNCSDSFQYLHRGSSHTRRKKFVSTQYIEDHAKVAFSRWTTSLFNCSIGYLKPFACSLDTTLHID